MAAGESGGVPFNNTQSMQGSGGGSWLGDVTAYIPWPLGDGRADTDSGCGYFPPDPGLGAPFQSVQLSTGGTLEWTPIFGVSPTGLLTSDTWYELDFDVTGSGSWTWAGSAVSAHGALCTVELRDRTTQGVLFADQYQPQGAQNFYSVGALPQGLYTLRVTAHGELAIGPVLENTVDLSGTFAVSVPSPAGSLAATCVLWALRRTRAQR